MKTQSCECCYYYDNTAFDKFDDPKNQGHCKRFPPLLCSNQDLTIKRNDSYVQYINKDIAYYSFPVMRETDWCGEFKIDPDLREMRETITR